MAENHHSEVQQSESEHITDQSSAADEMLLAAYGLTNEPVTLSACVAPISPYGVGEMIRAAKIEVSALDNYLHEAEIHGPLKCNLNKPTGAKVLAAKRYQTISKDKTNETIKINSPKLEHAEQTIKNISVLNEDIKAALSVPVTQLSDYTTINQRTKQSDTNCNQVAQRRNELMPYAEKYIQKMGYTADNAEAEKILQETVNFYSTSPALAETLRNLVQSL